MTPHTTQCPTCGATCLLIDDSGKLWTLPLPHGWPQAIHATQPGRPQTTIHLPRENNPTDLLDAISETTTLAAHTCGPPPPTTATDLFPSY